MHTNDATNQAKNTSVDNLSNLSQNQDSSEDAVLESFAQKQDLNTKASESSTEESVQVAKEPMKSRLSNQPQMKVLAGLAVAAIIAGVATGYGGFKLQTTASGPKDLTDGGNIQQVAEEASAVAVGDVFGVNDPDTFKDSAEGYLEIGGLDGEGSHKLLREGGESQTIYLTSSITDLDTFDGMQVKINGETFKGQKAGWLMDVGRVEVLDTDAEPPQSE